MFIIACKQTQHLLMMNLHFSLRKTVLIIGVSLDGDKEVNKYRIYPNGKSSFDDILKGIDILKKHNVSFNVLSVLTKNTALNFRKAYRFLSQTI